ncbi:MAG: FmdE family protein [Nitrospirota bacterium]
MLTFHGHKCWASTVGLRAGLAGLRVLGAKRSGAKSLHAILETGYMPVVAEVIQDNAASGN